MTLYVRGPTGKVHIQRWLREWDTAETWCGQPVECKYVEAPKAVCQDCIRRKK